MELTTFTQKRIKIIILILITFFNASCKKNFLDAKPSTSIVSPSTLKDLQGLLENADITNNFTPMLSQMASDDYVFIDYPSWQGTQTATERNSYIWSKDLYAGASRIRDWTNGYSAIFYCNNVLDVLENNKLDNSSPQYRLVKGWALFLRGFALYDLVRNFSPVYNNQSSNSDLGLPIRLTPGIDEIQPRSSLEKTYTQIIFDVTQATSVLDPTMPANSNRPFKGSGYALLSRIYLSMGKYDLAEKYADSTLSLTSKLVDYNTIGRTSTADPFGINNDEVIFNCGAINNTYLIGYNNIVNTQVTVNPELIKMYDINDLRLSVYFAKNPNTNQLYVRRGYYPVIVPFTGLATDEIYLIKAECLARRNQQQQALDWLNSLLVKRFTANKYTTLTIEDAPNTLQTILDERRKELVWRTLRWSDLKRLNKEGANISLSRSLNGVIYTLPPNDPRYVFPIPDDEIALSGIQQNIR